MRYARLALAALCIAFVLTDSVPAQAGWVEFFFPSLKKKPVDPMDTLTAPFALDPNAKAPAVKPDPMKAILPVNGIPLDQPHRNNEEISDWLENILPQTLSFDSANYRQELAKQVTYFTAGGKDQYITFLTDNNIIKVLDSKKFDVKSFVQDTPLLLNEGNVNGSYRWLYEIPIMLSYIEHGMTDYKKMEPINQKIVLTVQLGRSTTSGNDEGVLIERWEGQIQRIDTK